MCPSEHAPQSQDSLQLGPTTKDSPDPAGTATKAHADYGGGTAGLPTAGSSANGSAAGAGSSNGGQAPAEDGGRYARDDGSSAVDVDSLGDSRVPLSDLVVVQVSCVHRLPLIREAGPHWRKGVRTFVVLNNSELVERLNQEVSSGGGGGDASTVYAYYPDDEGPKHKWRGSMPSDTRLALAPFMAHQHFGDTYKWMLFGDDDTIFYMHGVRRLLAQYDPDQPALISDNWWHKGQHPHPETPRCLPCSFNTSSLQPDGRSYYPRPACPFCTRGLAWGTYDPTRYTCNATHEAFFRQHLDARLWQLQPPPPPPPESRLQSASSSAPRSSSAGPAPDAMRALAANHSSFMAMHAALAAKRRKPHERLDWEMRGAGAAPVPGAPPYEELPRWLRNPSKALGEAAAAGRASAQLGFPFCARHDPRLHGAAADSLPGGAGFHGGAGALFSVGLMRMVDPAAVIDFILHRGMRRASGGDNLIAHAVGQLMGLGVTDPGSALLAGGAYTSYVHFVDSNRQRDLRDMLRDPWAAIEDDKRPELARQAVWLVENVVATHAHAQLSKSAARVQDVAAHMQQLAERHRQALKWIMEERARGLGQPPPGAPTSAEALAHADAMVAALRVRGARKRHQQRRAGRAV